LRQLLVLNHEALGERMTGPTIRNWEIARALGREIEVTLAAPGEPGRTGDGFPVVGYGPAGIAGLVAEHSVVLASGYLLDRHPELGSARHLAVDLYDPFPLENLHMHKAVPLAEQHRIAAADRSVLTRLIRSGDVFFCASQRQRDFWTGWLVSAGRVNPYVHEQDPALSSLLRLLPFGIDERPPRPAARRFRGVLPGVGDDALLVLWGGGIWNWFDPLTLIRAVDRVKDRLPQVRLGFPASASPSTEVPPMQMSANARRLSDELGLTGQLVFFGATWVPYEERGGMLLEADIGVSTHQLDVETRYSFRTRILDFLWASLPVLTTEGDSLADLVSEHELGQVVGYGDVDGIASALLRLADPDHRRRCSQRSGKSAAEFLWPKVVQPLLDYCREPMPAPDRRAIAGEATWDRALPEAGGAGRLGRRAIEILRREGPGAVVSRGVRYVRRYRG